MQSIGIIGYGNMGSSIAQRIKAQYKVYVFDKDKNTVSSLKDIEASGSLKDLTDRAQIILLAIKPQDLDGVLNEIKDYAKEKMIISIAAGIPTRYIEKALGNVRVIRAMPNMGVRIGKSVTCLCKGEFAATNELLSAQELFNALGATRIIDENLMNTVTAVSGSGPAYYFDMIESKPQEYKSEPLKLLKDFINLLTEAAEAAGLGHKDAKVLSTLTGHCAQALIVETGLSPLQLIRQIASKGGTTEAALEVLHTGGSLKEAVRAALKRAEELSRKD